MLYSQIVIQKFQSLKLWVAKHERKLSSAALGVGFIVDSITLKRIDLPFENLILLGYMALVALCIITLNFLEFKKTKTRIGERLALFLPFVLQFAFGGLFSGFTIFYSRSGSLTSSWPFILILIALLIGNEVLKRQYERLVFQITVFFTAVFFFTIFAVPVLIGTMGPWTFLLSGFISLALVSAFVYLLYIIVPQKIREGRRPIIMTLSIVFIFINILYFTNIIPPIPLSLKGAGVYHGLVRSGNDYLAREESRSWLRRLQVFDNVHITPGQSIYIYSSVFAPTKIKADIIHNWQYFDPIKRRWTSTNRIPFAISGGSDRGYRGHSYKKNMTEGSWRVDVETSRGQVVGRVTFEIIYVDETPELIDVVL